MDWRYLEQFPAVGHVDGMIALQDSHEALEKTSRKLRGSLSLFLEDRSYYPSDRVLRTQDFVDLLATRGLLYKNAETRVVIRTTEHNPREYYHWYRPGELYLTLDSDQIDADLLKDLPIHTLGLDSFQNYMVPSSAHTLFQAFKDTKITEFVTSGRGTGGLLSSESLPYLRTIRYLPSISDPWIFRTPIPSVTAVYGLKILSEAIEGYFEDALNNVIEAFEVYLPNVTTGDFTILRNNSDHSDHEAYINTLRAFKSRHPGLQVSYQYPQGGETVSILIP